MLGMKQNFDLQLRLLKGSFEREIGIRDEKIRLLEDALSQKTSTFLYID